MTQLLGNSPRVLIVEDRDPIAAEYLQALADASYDARTARDAAEALPTAALWQPHLVAARLRLPGRSDGLELARRVRTLRWRPKIVLRGDPHDEQQALQAMEARVDLWIGEDVGAPLFVRFVESLLFPPCEGRAPLTGIFRYAGLIIRLAHQPALCRIEPDMGPAVRLSENDVRILSRLLQTPAEEVTVDALARSGWGLPMVDDPRHNPIVTALARLRHKLAAAAGAGAEPIIRRKDGRYSIALPEQAADGGAAEGSLSLDSARLPA